MLFIPHNSIVTKTINQLETTQIPNNKTAKLWYIYIVQGSAIFI